MSVKMDFNVGTILTVLIFMVTQSGAAIWLMAGMNADIQAMRSWQIRQDDRLVSLEESQQAVRTQNQANNVLLGVIRDEVEENSQLILKEIRNN